MQQVQLSARESRLGACNFEANFHHLIRLSIERHGKKNLQQFAAKAHAKSLGKSYQGTAQDVSAGYDFDAFPRILPPEQWTVLSLGAEQRARAVEAFLDDLYGECRVVQRAILSERDAFEYVVSSSLAGVSPPGGAYGILTSVECIPCENGDFYCVEKGNPTAWDIANLHANRAAMQRTFPEIFAEPGIAPISAFWKMYRRALFQSSNGEDGEFRMAVAAGSPSIEMDFIADRMGAASAIWNDFRVFEGKVALRTITGLKPIQILCNYGDSLPDPLYSSDSNPEGMAGLLSIYRAGGIMIANAPDAGVAASNVVHARIPELIKFYLDEEPLLENWPSWPCDDPRKQKWILENLCGLQILKTSEFGGMTVFDGTMAGKGEAAEFRKRIEASPENFIAKLPFGTTSLSDFEFMPCSKIPERITIFILQLNGRFAAVKGGVSKFASLPENANSSDNSRFRDVWVVQGDADAVSSC